MERFILDGQYKELFTAAGVDVGAVLKKAGLPEDLLNRRKITLTEEAYYRFLETVGLVAGNPDLPIQLASGSQIQAFSAPIFAAWCSPNGKVCLERLARYKKLIGPMELQLEEQGDTLSAAWVPGNPSLTLPAFLVQSETAFLLAMLRKATGEKILPREIQLQPGCASPALEAFAGRPFITGDRNRMTFARKDMELPFISRNEALWDYFEPEMNRRLADLEVDESTSGRVRSALTELLPGENFSIGDAARKLGLSTRTLQRKLAEEGTSFQKQVNSIREVLALHYLDNTDMSTSDIAYLLGYAELNSFLRAFTVWTGKTVSQWRKKKRRGPLTIDH